MKALGKASGLLASCLLAGLMLLGALPGHAEDRLTLRKISRDHGTFHYVVIPRDASLRVQPGISDTLIPLEKFGTLIAADVNAAHPIPALINAGFFDPANQQTTSYVTLDGKLELDPTQNARLTENQNIAPYLPRIFNRSEFRVYDCNGRTRYAITRHLNPLPRDCTLKHALGAGPMLLPARLDQEEAFVDYGPDKKLTRDPVGVNRRDARSAVGLTCNGDVILAMGAQIPDRPAGTGFSLADMARELKKLGAVQALALDGGSSSGLQVEGVTVYGKYDKQGRPVIRAVKSFLMALPPENAQ